MEEAGSGEGGSGGAFSQMDILTAQVLLKKGKRYAAKYLRDECLRNLSPGDLQTPRTQVLGELLDLLLNPAMRIKNWDTIDWLKWLMAAGRTPDDFFNTVRRYDNATTCGLVWTANFVAYRCRTCGISPCMSLCAQCFQEGNHEGHDFNMFRSQAGGACDCGNSAVMKESGFCHRHGSQAQLNKPEVPPDLLAIADALMPRIFLRFIQHCREHSPESLDQVLEAMEESSLFLDLLQDLSRLGAAMRKTMTKSLCNPIVYRELTQTTCNHSNREYLLQSGRLYEEALNSIPFGEVPPGYQDVATLNGPLIHKTFLDEIVFWTVKFEFPQKLVCLLLNMLPDTEYEDAFARAFVQHYSRISVMLVQSTDSETLSNRVVHVSVQLFSDQDLAYRMTDSFHLLHVMIVSLKNMMKSICVPSTLHDKLRNSHKVVNCADHVMKNHCYWPLVSDLNNVLSHKPIAVKFMSDPRLIQEWFSFLSMFQGMNVNVRELTQHVEFEPQTYYAAFSAELEASASPMWALVSHLRDSETRHYTFSVLKECLHALKIWFMSVGFSHSDLGDPYQVSFHLPLHRYYSVFMCQAVKAQGAQLHEVLPSQDLLHHIMVHPLRLQAAFYEILSGMWVRNGLQIKGQAMTYIQCHFCNSMVDADLYLLQICAGELPPDNFILTVLDRFHVMESLSVAPRPSNSFLDSEHEMTIMESCLTFLATLMTVRTNIGLSESELAQLEMVTLLCMGDKTHSQLMEYMPEKCGSAAQSRDFEVVLSKVSSYRAPNFEASGTMQQGMYIPRDEVWENLYDPIYILLRAVQRRDFQASLDRFKLFCKQSGNISSSGNLWPPFRLPSAVTSPYTDPQRIIACRSFHAVIFMLLYKALNEVSTTDHLLALTVYLLELTVEYQAKHRSQGGEVMAAQYYDGVIEADDDKPDSQFCKWFVTDDIFSNVNSVVSRIHLNPIPSVSSCSGGELDTSDLDMDEIEGGEPLLALHEPPRPLPLPAGSELVLYHQGATACVPSGDLPTTPDTPTQDHMSPLALPPPTLTSTSPVSTPTNMLVPVTQSSSLEGHSAQASLPSPFQYRTLLAGNEVGRIGGSGRSGSNNGPACSSRGHHGRCIMLQHHFHQRSRRPAGPAKALLPAGDGASSPSFQASPPTPDLSHFSSLPQLDSGDEYVAIEESIISLLIKLHSKLTGKPNSYRPNFSDTSDSRIGDGPFFITKLLNKIGRNDSSARQGILETISCLYCKREEDSSASSEEEARAREEKKKRAKERQKRVIAEFANRQRQFMEQNKAEAAESETSGNDAMEVEEEQPERHKEYDCVICNQSIPSTPERPVGLVVLLQATSVLGHRTSSQKPLGVPTTDSERTRLKQRRYTLGQYMEERTDTLNRHFDYNSWLVSMNIGWEGGVHVQTCGHHLHLDCHQSYLLALRSQPRPNNPLNVDKGEYWCPLCRQLGNSVLPISPEIGDLSAMVKHPSTHDSDLVEEVDRLLLDLTVPTFSSTLTKAMAQMMEDMTIATYAKYRNVSSNPSTPSLFMFVSSILRTNLEVELVQRGGMLVYQAQDVKMDVKRSCLMPLLHVLGFHSKILSGGGDSSVGGMGGGLHWIRQTWASITQRPVTGSEGAVTPREREVPLLLRDPVSLLLQLILLLPSRIDQGYLRCVVRNVYRVAVVGAAVSALRSLNESQREQATTSGPLAPLLALAHNTLRDSPFFCDDQVPLADQTQEAWTVNDVTCQVRETCLLFLRIAALLKAHLMEENAPVIADPIAECGALEQYLGVWDICSVVNSTIMGNMCGTYRASEVSSPVETRLGDLAGGARVWCSEVASFASQAQVAASTLLTTVHFSQPRLLRLPHSYDAIFQYYHRRQCSQCNSVPKDPSVCLLCGTIVCLREPCCKQQEVCECVQHAIDCGAGTAIFLVVNASTVIVIRGPRVCLWGCIHLDSFGEEDRELKRGKPLYLSEDRYRLLEQQWLSHSFDHTNRRWIWHRDIL
ncbi:E3 ubiquitin-protein ligase ubr3-like [Homarus americanus]|uniref:E3 ubiquitin-protein ligase ubr3-like n=1 Tax=Homarus americanus TaxID=6706 RepID=UPI001C44D369|nr:E3 ubiquitin-protein ligase ubr3-like [Homarus americanus]